MVDVDAIRINFSHDQLTFMNICLGFLMFGVAQIEEDGTLICLIFLIRLLPSTTASLIENQVNQFHQENQRPILI